MSALQIADLTYSINRRPILNKLSLHLAKGKIAGIIGVSGIGKSTLLQVIAGLIRPETGTVVLDGKVLTDKKEFVPPEKRGIGIMFQDYAVLPHLNVSQNMVFGMKRVPKEEHSQRSDFLLNMVGMYEYRERFPHELSGGQLQRVALARTLAGNFRFIAFDEPFSSFEKERGEKIAQKVREYLHQRGISAFIVSHCPQDIQMMCDTTFCMCDSGPPIRQLEVPAVESVC